MVTTASKLLTAQPTLPKLESSADNKAPTSLASPSTIVDRIAQATFLPRTGTYITGATVHVYVWLTQHFTDIMSLFSLPAALKRYPVMAAGE